MSIAKPTLYKGDIAHGHYTLFTSLHSISTQIIRYLFNFICRYIPLKQWIYDDSHSPKYQKFKIDELPKILHYEPWDYRDYIPYIEWRYGKKIKPVSRRSECDIDNECKCPRCNAPKPYLYKNNGSKGQLLCKVCSTKFRCVMRITPIFSYSFNCWMRSII